MSRCLLPPFGVYHVTTRGVAKNDIVLDDADRVRWSRLLDDVIGRCQWACLAYCLLDNHFHLIVETKLELLSRGMHRLNGVYAQRFNERHDRVGHLFQERYHVKLIRDEQHLAYACDYVRANPVRAGLCTNVEDWPWSGVAA